MTDEGLLPLAFSGSRLAWSDLPRDVRAHIAEVAGAEVAAEAPATTGFSPGYASLLELGDGTEVFVKAVSPEQNPDSPTLARAEIAALRLLPAAVPAPPLVWSYDDGTWVVMGIEAVPGRAPHHPWHPDELARVLDVAAELAAAGTPAPEGLPELAAELAPVAAGWARLVESPTDLAAAVAAVGEHGPWVEQHLAELTQWSGQALGLAAGDTLAHHDLRADNVLLGDDDVWVVDWPHATRGAARWFDLAGLLVSIAMQGGADPEELFWPHPNAVGADRAAVRAVLAALAGSYLQGAVQPPPVGIGNLRPFQLAHARAALDWLRRF